MKQCTKCGDRKPIDDYYAHPLGKDGKMSACKTCHRAAVIVNRSAKREQYAEYERRRFQDVGRKARVHEYVRAHNKRHPDRSKARTAVGNAVRDGRIIRSACEVCGSPKSQAHHADYSKPLDVRWLCFKHHRELEHGQVTVAP